MSRDGSALYSMIGLCAALAGCQLVFGLDDFETGAGPAAGSGGAGGAGAGTTGDGGAGASTSTTTMGSGGCDCGLDPIWSPVALVDQGDASGSLPGECGDTSSPINVFSVEKPGMCSSCSCTASGCAPPGLQCFSAVNCQGPPVTLDPGSACGTVANIGDGFDSCHVAGAIEGTCDTTGGQPTQVGPPFDLFLSFCAVTSCDGDCDAACVTSTGVPAGGCPEAFSHHYELPLSGEVDCEACSCTASCGADTYRGGTFNCNFVGISGTSCTDVNGGLAMNYARFSASPSCTANHDATYPGVVQLGALQTVCCKDPIAGVAEN